MVTDRREPTQRSMVEARRVARDLLNVLDGDDYDAAEHFAALCGYVDALHGGGGFTHLLEPAQRSAVAAVVGRLRGRVPTPSPTLVDRTRVAFSRRGLHRRGAVAVRLRQPVNSSLTLAEGRRVAVAMATRQGWQRQVGCAMQELYHYLDELYGGCGAFDELLNSEDRVRVAQLVATLSRR